MFGTLVKGFMVMWANPQALIDGTLLFGSFRASLSADMSTLFIME